MASYNSFLSTSTTNITFLPTNNNLPSRFCCDFFKKNFALAALPLKYFNFVRRKKMFQIFSPSFKKKKKISETLVYVGIDSKRYLHMFFFPHSLYLSLGTNCVFWPKDYLISFICSKTSLCLSRCLC